MLDLQIYCTIAYLPSRKQVFPIHAMGGIKLNVHIEFK